MFALGRILLLILIILGVYALWPRKTDLTGYRASTAAAYEVKALESASAKKYFSATWNYYLLFERELKIAPITALRMAQSWTRALSILRNAQDEADQEQALIPLREYFVLLKRASGGSFETERAARAAMMTLLAYNERASQDVLSDTIAQGLSIVYGGEVDDHKAAAKAAAEALALIPADGSKPTAEQKAEALQKMKDAFQLIKDHNSSTTST